MEALKKSLIVIISGYFSVVLLAVTDPRVRVEMAGIGIEADHLSMKDSLAHVLGNVRLTGENFYARCEDLEYDICTKDIHANALDIAMERGYASAEEAFFSSERITLKNADIGLNAGGGGMVPHLKTEHMEYDRRKRKGMARSARIKIGEIPLIIPSVTVGDWVRFVGLRFDGGHSKKLGGYIQSEMTYNIYEDLHWGLLWDVYTKRGVLIGPVVKVDSEGELICSHLDLRTGYICDRGERGADIDGVAIEKKRWYIDGKQHHHLWERVDILSDFLWASDGQIGKDFYSNDDADIRDSFGELDYRGENDLWTLFSRVKMNRYQHFPQQIPSIRWERFPQEIFDSGIYYFGYIDFTRQKFTQEGPEHPGQWEAVEQNRIDIYWGINRPTELGCGINFTPLLGGRWTHYCGDCDRFLGELGFDWGADFYAFYPSTFPW
ncbi:MAG: hypothetical protein LBR92_00025, partial [Puniceicoccales bacterium]|nr:hypothetical protein [Puniceicoccales bacterium]